MNRVQKSLILAGALLGYDDEKAKVFDIAIQTGAIFAVILVYWQRLRERLQEHRQRLPTMDGYRLFSRSSA